MSNLYIIKFTAFKFLRLYLTWYFLLKYKPERGSERWETLYFVPLAEKPIYKNSQNQKENLLNQKWIWETIEKIYLYYSSDEPALQSPTHVLVLINNERATQWVLTSNYNHLLHIKYKLFIICSEVVSPSTSDSPIRFHNVVIQLLSVYRTPGISVHFCQF